MREISIICRLDKRVKPKITHKNGRDVYIPRWSITPLGRKALAEELAKMAK